MNNYQKLDLSRVLDLQVTRRGFFRAEHILSDGQFEYGLLGCSGKGIFSRERQIDTANGNFIVRPIGWLGKEVQILNADTSEVIGSFTRNTWDTRKTITFNNGFIAEFRRDGGIFSRTMSWYNAELGNIIQIKACYKYSRPFSVTFNPAIVGKDIPFTLLTLLGVHIILIKQAQAAAAT